MSDFININKLVNILPEFVDSRLMPSAPPHVKFLLGGAIPLIISRQSEILNTYGNLLETLGIYNPETNEINISKASAFIRAGFNKTPTVSLLGFTFNGSDGEALISLLNKYSGGSNAS